MQALGCAAAGQVDVTSEASVAAFVRGHVGADAAVHLLLNVAGVAAGGVAADSLAHVDAASLRRLFDTNAAGPLLVTQALLPHLRRAAASVGTEGGTYARAAVVSSRLGSITDNTSGGMYAYRASKAAVNALFKSLAVDLKSDNITVLLLHPGIVRTNILPEEDMLPQAIEPEDAAVALWRVLMSKGLESTGTFWHKDGTQLPW